MIILKIALYIVDATASSTHLVGPAQWRPPKYLTANNLFLDVGGGEGCGGGGGGGGGGSGGVGGGGGGMYGYTPI